MSEKERSLFSKLWNKVYYEADKFVNDPEANKLADKRESKKVVEHLDTEVGIPSPPSSNDTTVEVPITTIVPNKKYNIFYSNKNNKSYFTVKFIENKYVIMGESDNKKSPDQNFFFNEDGNIFSDSPLVSGKCLRLGEKNILEFDKCASDSIKCKYIDNQLQIVGSDKCLSIASLVVAANCKNAGKLSITVSPNNQALLSGDPNKFSATRLFSKTWIHLSNNAATYAVPFVSLMLSMLVANEAIVYTPPVRILFFIATFVICVMFNAYLAFLAFFYIVKAGYSYYVNNMTDGPKRNIFPTIFAILPITTYEPTGAFTSFLLSPFRYPKSEEKQAKLPELMKDYWNLLLASFPGLDKVKNQPTIAKGLKNIEEQFSHLHDIKTSVLDLNVTKNKPETNGV